MGTRQSDSRRKFLKQSVQAAAATAVVPGTVLAQKQPRPDPIIINPKIDNLRVVCCHDPAMVTGKPTTYTTIAGQNEPVVVERVQANINAMAMKLAQKGTPKEAWETIYQKPANKEWSQVKVAIKANCKTLRNRNDPMNNPRLAVLDSICKGLNSIGIPFGSIILYDDDDEDATIYTSFLGNGLPSGIKVSRRNNELGGEKITAAIPAPYNRDGKCTKHIADGTIDILINVGMNKGHNSTWGNATITMKNHLGTFDPRPHETNRLFGINKSDAIIGGNPVRQQLCFVDSLYASRSGPSAIPDFWPNRLIMGTFSPVVDYLTIKKIREDVMGLSHSGSVVNRYLTEFGYSVGDVTDLVNVDPVPITTPKPQRRGHGTQLSLSLPKHLTNRPTVRFDLPTTIRPLLISVYSLQGKEIASIIPSVKEAARVEAHWDGRNQVGRVVGSGTYVVTVKQSGRAFSKQIHITR